MSYLSHLESRFTGERWPADRLRGNPGTDGDVLEARYDLDRMARELDRDTAFGRERSLWRFAPLLPSREPCAAVTLGEGGTPLLDAPALARSLDCRWLRIKDEGVNPTGSFKDRGASVAVTCLREHGVRIVVHNSSGNAAAAWALYCARAGLECVNILPDDVLPASMRQCELAGARNYRFDGPWHESGALVGAAVETHGWFNCGTFREPYRLEGKKTMGLEIAEQLGYELPDVIVYPTGGGLGVVAIYKAFAELRALGWVSCDRMPRLLAVQYAGCAPIHRAWREGAAQARPWTDLDVLPGGLKSARPPGDRAVLALLRETEGAAVAVSAEAALDAVKRLARLEGMLAAPESATVVAGLGQALDDGLVSRDERIVLLCTGSGLKSVPVLPACDEPPRARSVGDLAMR